MLVAWKYRERDTVIQRLDPRARLIFMLAMTFSIIQFWDLRIELLFLVVAFAQVFLARLTWQETRRSWLLISLIITFMTILTFLTGRGGVGYAYHEEHLIARLGPLSLPLVGWQLMLDITVEKTAFAMSQIVRMFTITAMAIAIPYTIDPSLYGVTFRGLGVPDKFAYAMDLAFPVTIGSITGGEDIIDAMDLRCFGIGPRTWVEKLHYKPRDWALIGISIAILALSTATSISGYGRLWVPPWLLQMAG